MPDPLLIANVLAPYVAWGVGDDASLSLPFSMLATTLAAGIERPFVKRSGFERSSYWFSMRANILSWLIGLLIAYASLIMRLEPIFFMMYFLAIPFSILIEGGFLSILAPKTKKQGFRWKPIVFGNLLSGIVLFVIVAIGFTWGDHLQRSGSALVAYLTNTKSTMHYGVLVLCSIWFFACFIFGYNRPGTKTINEVEHTDETAG